MSEQYRVGLITEESLENFIPFLTDNALKDIRDGEEYLVLGAVRGRKACGAIAGYQENDRLFRISSFYVYPELRREGIGTLLLDELMKGLCETDDEMALTLELNDEGGEEAEALLAFLYARGIPESDNDGSEGAHRFTFFVEG